MFVTRKQAVAFTAIIIAYALTVAATPQLLAQEQFEATPAQAEYGTGQFIRSPAGQSLNQPDRLASPVSAAFRDAEIETVINQIIGGALGLDYTVSNDVSGRVTLRMNGVETRSGVLRQLRDTLASAGIHLIDRGDFIAIVRGNPGGQTGAVEVLTPGTSASAGTGIAVFIPLHAVPSAVSPIISSLSPNARLAMSDDSRNIIVYTGEAAALTSASQALALLDVDWFSAVSTGLFPLEHATPQELIGELQPLLGPLGQSVELVAIDRLNLIIALAPSARQLNQVEHWIDRLDQPRAVSTSSGQMVYSVRHSDPEDLINSLYQLLGAGRRGMSGSNYQDPRGGLDYESGQAPYDYGRGNAARPMFDDSLQIGAAPNQNIILVRGDPDRVAEVSELLVLLDRPRPQVQIEAAIVEVTLTDEMSFGVNWAGVINDHVSIGWSDDASAGVSARYPGVSATYLNVGLEAAITALSSQTELEVISRPSVLALHNEQAELQVGDQVPVVLQSAVSIDNPDAPLVNQTAYRNTGVILTVTPQIRAGGLVEIEITQEVSGVAQTTSSGIDSPTITQRRIASTLLIPSGEAVALGGLISERRTAGGSGVPVLRDIPVLGRAFRSDSRSLDRTELLVILTPQIINDPADLVTVMDSLPAALARLEARLSQE